MACFSPLKGFRIGRTPSGANKYKICSWITDHVDYNWSDAEAVVDPSEPTPKGWLRQNEFIEIPCGQCIGCRQQRSREWANRLMCEARGYDENWFITLTYDDFHVPTSEWIDDDGEFRLSLTLQPKDLQDFWKRLRKSIEPEKIRYFAAGEYGDTTARPHYHAIVFGLHIPDLCYYRSIDGYNYYYSDYVNHIWSKGNVIIASVNWASCAYVAAYCTKKLTGDLGDKVYGKLNIVPPFNVMSRRPGIGRDFYESEVKNLDVSQKYIYLSSDEKGIKFSRPRYFKKLDMANDNAPFALSSDIGAEVLELHKNFVDIAFDNKRNRDIIEQETSYIKSLEGRQADAVARLKARKEMK